ncbi:MAG: RusA family crossover junction endodeoxyribonuclease [Clostridium sp.]
MSLIIIEGKVKGKARPRFNTKTGRAYSTDDTISYENWIRWCYRHSCNDFIDGPIRATIKCFMEIPKSYSKKKIKAIEEDKLFPTKKPDVDNIAKIVLDSLNGIAYKDDAQVVELVVLKKFTTEKERVELELESLI